MVSFCMLVDTATITIKAGNGGHACYRIRAKRLVGGDGGDGGDAYVVGTSNMSDLSQFRGITHYEAENGENGQDGGKQGKTGKDIDVLVPFGTMLFLDGNRAVTITPEKPRYLVARGKKGAFGNLSQKRLHIKLTYADEDVIAPTITVGLDYKIRADVLFLGYPNAGKSSMLNRLTRANAKVAPYAFTTLEPQLGRMGKIILMDLPGLIDGTHEGKGLGTSFLKHTISSKLVAHFVALDTDTPYKNYLQLREEIEKIDKSLSQKKEIILLTKSDEVTPELAIKVQKEFKKHKLETIVCSLIDDESVEKIKQKIEQSLL